MSELNCNGFFDALKNEQELFYSKKYLTFLKEEEDKWWDDYKNNKVVYKNKK